MTFFFAFYNNQSMAFSVNKGISALLYSDLCHSQDIFIQLVSLNMAHQDQYPLFLTKEQSNELFLQAKKDLKSNRYHNKYVNDCFLGKDLVSWIQNKFSVDENMAIEIGRKWQNEYKWFNHCSSNLPLQNQNLFYCWPDKKNISRSTSIDSASVIPLEQPSNEERNESVWFDFSNGISDLFPYLNFENIVRNLVLSSNTIFVKNRNYYRKSYRDSFSGKDAVNWMKDKLMLDRKDAIILCQHIMKLDLIKSVDEKIEIFSDSNSVYSVNSSIKLNINSSSIISSNFGFSDTTNISSPVLLNYCLKQILKNECYKTKDIFKLSLNSTLIDRIVLFIGCCNDGGISLMNHIKGHDLPILYSQLIKIFYSELTTPPISNRILVENEIKNIDIKDETKNKILLKISSEIKNIPKSYGLLPVISLLQKVGNSNETGLTNSELSNIFAPLLFTTESEVQSQTAVSILTLLISNILTIYGPNCKLSEEGIKLRTNIDKEKVLYPQNDLSPVAIRTNVRRKGSSYY